MADNRPNEHQPADEGNEHAHLCDEADGTRGERGHPLPCERRHAPPRVLRYTCKSLFAGVVDDTVRKSDHGHDTAQEEIHLRILCERRERPPVHQAKIRVVEHDVGAERPHRTIEALRRKSFEKCI